MVFAIQRVLKEHFLALKIAVLVQLLAKFVLHLHYVLHALAITCFSMEVVFLLVLIITIRTMQFAVLVAYLVCFAILLDVCRAAIHLFICKDSHVWLPVHLPFILIMHLWSAKLVFLLAKIALGQQFASLAFQGILF